MQKIRISLFAAFAAILIVVTAAAYLLYQKINEISISNQKVEHTNLVINQLDNLETFLKDAETGQRGFLLTGDSSFLQPYISVQDDIMPTLDSIKRLTADETSQRLNVRRLDIWVGHRINFLRINLENYQPNSAEFKKNFILSRQSMDSCRIILAKLRKEELTLLRIRNENQEELETGTPESFRNLLIIYLGVLIFSFFIIYREFQRRVKYQQNLQTKVEQLSESYKEMQQVAFVMSHHLQEPLRKIQVFSSRITGRSPGNLSSDVFESARKIESFANDSRRLMENLSDFASTALESKEQGQVSLHSLLDTLIIERKTAQPGPDVRYINGTEGQIEGYEDQLRILFNELFDNSIKFSQTGLTPVITITSRKVNTKSAWHEIRRNKLLEVIVTDNGIGFDEHYGQKILQLFQVLDKNNDQTGKGIGLAKVKRIMVNHGGFIKASGAPGKGASFHLFFPIGN